jgi:SAM-dependent methyltransferase
MHYQVEARSRQTGLIGQLILDTLGIVVDLGCGIGYFVSLIQQKGAFIDLLALRFTKGFCKNQEFILATSIPIRDQSVDKVLCTEVLEHVTNDSAVIEEFFRILHTDGICVFSSPNASFPFRSEKSSHTDIGPELHARPGYSPDKFAGLLCRVGFGHVEQSFALPLIGTLLIEILERLHTTLYGPLKSQIELQNMVYSRMLWLYRLLFPLFLLAVRASFPKSLGETIIISRGCRS